MKSSIPYKQMIEGTMYILNRNLQKAQQNPRDSMNLFYHSLGVVQLWGTASFGAVSPAQEEADKAQMDALIDQIHAQQFIGSK